MIEDIVGYLGGISIAISFIPQVVKSYKTKRVSDLSLGMIIAQIIGTILWLVYGFLVGGKPIIFMNSFFIFVILYLLYLKVKYEK
ncbi:hypothetical protein HYX08_00880 [Candidatus Woesearchaeota archaeon]|nr:hypothetical protein [Candidatus Woesearchaeota archaeon]